MKYSVGDANGFGDWMIHIKSKSLGSAGTFVTVIIVEIV